MNNLLWLDDLRNPFLDEEKRVPLGNDKWNINWVLNFEQFTKWIEMYGLPDAISFDHDLAPEHYTPEYFWSDYNASKKYQEWKKLFYTEFTGEHCAKWLVNYCNTNRLDLPIYYIHSANPVGFDFILNQLTNK